MDQMYGWTGKLLRVDLTEGRVWTEDTSKYVPDFIGGMGIAAKIAWDEIEPGTDAFDPENRLFLMVGPLTGTLASGASRVLVAGIAPQQNPPVFSRSGMGGHWGAEVKFSGFDGIIIQGRAEKPVYLWVHDGECEIRDAEDLWGTGTYNTTSVLRARHGEKTRVVACGQAGEHLVRFACIQTETGNAAGQGGFGAVMGSKNLKAVAAHGTQGVKVAHPKRLLEMCLKDPHEGQSPHMANSGPGRRGPQQSIENSRDRKCGYCATPCTNRLYMDVPGEVTHGVYSAARHCWGYQTSHNAHIETRAMTGDYGINGWEVSYGMIPWLKMCKQHGLIDTFEGIEIDVPDHPVVNLNDSGPVSGELIAALLHKITYREGELGDALAEGTCRAAEKLFDGKGLHLVDHIYPRHFGQTNHWNGHWGTGGSPYFPFWLVPVMQFCVDTRDPASDSTHQYTEHVLRYLPEHGPHRGSVTPEEAAAVCQQVYGNPDCWDPKYTYDQPDTKVLPAIFHHNRGMLVESLVLCDREHTRVFSMANADRKADTDMMSRLFSAVTGYETSEAELDKSSDRVFTLLRAIDIRNSGRSREDDNAVAASLTFPSFVDGVEMDYDQFMPMMDRYYEVRGWNPTNGWPTRAKLESLGLGEIADELASIGKLG